MEEQKIWQAALGELELTLSRANFTTWFKNTFIYTYNSENITIGVPNTFTKAWLEKKYHSAILKALQKITDNQVKVITYQVETKGKNQADIIIKKAEEKIAKTFVAETPRINEFGLNKRYGFNNFVIGKGNELAQAASIAISEKPGAVYNPLFIYGGVGLGKTHLAQAIGNKILESSPNKRVLYVSCEKFTNDFIKSISTNKVDKFKNIYRSADVWLVDDVQFLAGKESTQEEFFHTFNALHQNNKQVVMTADRAPKAIPAMESRLISRFEWGMIADISAPDLETRAAILKAKCKEKNCQLDEETIAYVATNVQNNVRELEGALNKIIAYHQLNGTAPILENVKKILSSIYSAQRKKSVTPKQIINIVAEFFDIKIDDLLGSCRKKNLAVPRQIVMYLMRVELKSSFPSIGQEIGNRDHTTAMHAHLKITKILDEDEKINQDVKLIKERLYN
ncbi:MAG: chromosomal replication initiator protein DnaA [Parcubacteria group bacterium]|nr:chromosomal replication initiator protein DnaA [Parcubacteria group bacterium]|tara:strand:+ start:4027 stop:5382 length:1356 start_codon:yes stop_codon:yes gene_type:complete